MKRNLKDGRRADLDVDKKTPDKEKNAGKSNNNASDAAIPDSPGAIGAENENAGSIIALSKFKRAGRRNAAKVSGSPVPDSPGARDEKAVLESRPSRIKRGSAVHRLVFDAALLCLALALAYLESLVPFYIVPLPGFKPGFANIVTLALICGGSERLKRSGLGVFDAAAVLLARITLSALLFGTPVTFLFSLAGAASAFLAMTAVRAAFRKATAVGVSAAAAVFHNLGQLCAAYFITGKGVLSYLPWLLLAGLATGVCTGVICSLICRRI